MLAVLVQKVKGQGHRIRKCTNTLKAIEWPTCVCTISSDRPLVYIIHVVNSAKELIFTLLVEPMTDCLDHKVQ